MFVPIEKFKTNAFIEINLEEILNDKTIPNKEINVREETDWLIKVGDSVGFSKEDPRLLFYGHANKLEAIILTFGIKLGDFKALIKNEVIVDAYIEDRTLVLTLNPEKI